MKIEELLLVEDREEEESSLMEIIRKDPTNVVASVRLGNILRGRGRYRDALKLHLSALSETNKSSLKKKIYLNIIKDYLEADNPQLALRYAGELQKVAELDVEELEFLCSVYERTSQWEEVINLKHRVLKLTKSSDDRGVAILYAFWGESLVKQGDKRDGLKRFKEALKIDKFCLPALLFMGDLYYEDGDVDESINLWRKILDNTPDFAFLAFERLANAYYARHNFSELESLYTSYLANHPEDVRVLIMLSEIYEKKGVDQEAIDILEHAIEVEPKNVIVKKKLFKLYYDNKRYGDMFKEGEGLASISGYKEFKCYNCGVQFVEFKFKCPDCGRWLSIR